MNQPKYLLEDVTFDFEDEEGLGPHLAYTMKMNGGAASKHNIPLMLKSDEVPEMSEELFKALEQVTVRMSFEEYLRKFFGMWHSDAELLAKLLGFQTEYEAMEAKEDEQEMNSYESYLEDKMSYIDIMRSAYQGEDIDLMDQVNLLDVRKNFEDKAEEFIDTCSIEDLEIVKGIFEDGFLSEDIEQRYVELGGEITKQKMKTVGGVKYSASDFAYVPDPEKVSTWKLLINDAEHTSAAVAALGEGFRGNKVEIPSSDLAAVKRKVRSAYRKFFPDNELPAILKAASHLSSGLEDETTEEVSKSSNPENNTEANKGVKLTDTNTVELEEVLKSEAAQDLIKGLIEAEVQKATAAKDAIIKKLEAKENERIRKGTEDLVKGFTSLEDETKEKLTEVLFKHAVEETEGFEVILDSLLKMQEAVVKAKEVFAEEEQGFDAQETTTVTDQKELVKSSLKDRIAEMQAAGMFK